MTRAIVANIKGYILAIAVTVAALLFSLLDRSVTEKAPSLLFFAAVILSAGFGGLGPGLLATLLSILFLDYFIFSPYNTISLNASTLIPLLVFAGVSTLINAFYRRYNRALKSAYEQREALNVTLTSIGDAVIAADAAGKITFLNPVAEALTGWALANAKDKPIETIFRIIHAKTRQPAEDLTAKVLKTGLTYGLANDTALISRSGAEYIIEDSAAPLRDRQGKLTGIVLTFRDVSEKYQAEAAQKLLMQVSDQLIFGSDSGVAFPQLARLLVADFAKWCEIVLVEDGQLHRQALVHADTTKETTLERFYEHLPATWDTAAQVARTGLSALDNQISDRWPTAEGVDANALDRLKTLQPNSQIYVPLLIHGQPSGVIGVTRSTDRPHFVQADVIFAEEAARRVAVAFENYRLSQQTQEARQEAERTARRIAQLQTITATLSTALLTNQVALIIVAQTLLTIDGVAGCIIGLLDEASRTLNIIYDSGYLPNSQVQWTTMSLDANLPASDVVRRGEPMFTNVEDWVDSYPELIQQAQHPSLALLPLRIDGKPIGFLNVSFREKQSFPEADRALLIGIADQCGQALHRAQLYEAEKQAREQMDTILENISDAFFSFDHEFRYRYLNGKALQMTGHTREELIGRKPQEFFNDAGDQPFYDNALRALTENKFIEYERYSPREKFWAAVRLYPYEAGLIVYHQDISARRQAEEEAQLSAIRLKRFVVSGVIGLVTSSDDGLILEANDKFLQMIGYSSAEIEAGQVRAADLTPPEYQAIDQAARVQALHTGKAEPYEKEYIHKDGHRVSVLIGGTRVQETWISFVLDLTERKLAERRLRVLTEVSALLASSLDYQTTLTQITRSVVPTVADWCTVYLTGADGKLQQVAIHHREPTKLQWMREVGREMQGEPITAAGVYRVVQSGQPEFYPNIPDELLIAVANGDERLLQIMREIGFSAVIDVPLKIQGQTIGVIQLASAESRQRYTADDLALAQDIALRAAAAIENARLYNEVHQQRERLQVTLTSIGDAVIATDAQGCITFINPIAEALTGWIQAEAISQDVDSVFHLIDGDTQKLVESPILKVLSAGTITSLDGPHTLLIARNGDRIPIDDSAAPINDVNGKLVGVILVFRDIRERREAEKQLHMTLQRTNDLYNTSRQIGTASTPKDLLDALLTSRYLQNTRQAMILVFKQPWRNDQPSDFTIAATLNDTVFPGLAYNGSLEDSALLKLFSGGHSVFIEAVAADPSLPSEVRALLQEYRVASLILLPLWVGNVCFGALALYCIPPNHWTDEDFQHIRIFADQVAIVMENARLLESEKRARKEAEYANELKLKFLAMISHELRTPLTSIKGFTTSLLATDVTWEPEQQHDFISIINTESDKLTDLISQLLDLSQLQAGMMRIRPSPQSLSRIVDGALIQLKALTPKHNLSIQIPGDLPPVLADAPRIAEVISNLVGNAAKYSPEGKTITVTAAWSGNMIQVAVSDQGPGIPPDSRTAVFEAFRQLERKSSERSQGAGLGLAICKGLVEAHGGKIWVADDSSSGTTICFTLPIADDQ